MLDEHIFIFNFTKSVCFSLIKLFLNIFFFHVLFVAFYCIKNSRTKCTLLHIVLAFTRIGTWNHNRVSPFFSFLVVFRYIVIDFLENFWIGEMKFRSDKTDDRPLFRPLSLLPTLLLSFTQHGFAVVRLKTNHIV